MKPSIILYKTLPDNLVKRLETHFTINQFSDINPETVAANAQIFANAEGILGSNGKVDESFLAQMPKLRAASTATVGYDNFNVDALNARNIILMHTPTVLTETVADTAMALILSSARRIVELAERVKAGKWQNSVGTDWYGINVHHKTLGIVGMGRIGMALAQRAHLGFSMPVIYNARRRHTEAEERFDAQYCDLDTLLSTADFVCILLPFTPETHHLIGAEQLAKMKSSAVLINIGRGPVVDEQALIEALQAGEIYGAGLDVFEKEPLSVDSPLLKMPNVVALPHIGSATHETRYDMDECAVDNLITALTGKVEINCVNPGILK